jgi:predicted ATPase
MVENVTGGKPLPDAVLEQIIEKTDGVPLFVEELTKTIVESGMLTQEADRYVVAGPLRHVAIPATLHDSLMARLDRLGAVKEVAQTASAIGREFDYDLLGAVSPLSFESLRDALSQLIDAGLVFRRGRSEEGAYIFKHALVQDAAYGSLLKSKHQELHQRIAQTLQDRFPERVESEPELLAHHFTEAGLFETAIEQWKRAGQNAADSSANTEVASHFSKALGLFNKLENAAERPQDELALQMPLAAALMAIKGFAAPEVGETYFRARELCHQLGDTSQTFPVLYGVFAYYFIGGHLENALGLAEECLDLAKREGERTKLLAAHSMMGHSLMGIARFDAAQHHFENSIALYDPEVDKDLWQTYGEDPGMDAIIWRIWVLWFKGFPEQALSKSRETLEITKRGSDLLSTGFALVTLAAIFCFDGDTRSAQELAQATIDFSTEKDTPVYRIFGTVIKGSSLIGSENPDESLKQLQLGLSEWKAAGIGLMVPFVLALVAQGHGRCGNLEEGLKLLSEALERAKRNGEGFWLPELHRLQGTFLLSLSSKNATEAETCFRKAIDVAQEQSAKSLELRAATSLAGLWQRLGKRDEARDLLAPVYEWFTEGFDTADLKEAKALLEQLS